MVIGKAMDFLVRLCKLEDRKAAQLQTDHHACVAHFDQGLCTFRHHQNSLCLGLLSMAITQFWAWQIGSGPGACAAIDTPKACNYLVAQSR